MLYGGSLNLTHKIFNLSFNFVEKCFVHNIHLGAPYGKISKFEPSTFVCW